LKNISYTKHDDRLAQNVAVFIQLLASSAASVCGNVLRHVGTTKCRWRRSPACRCLNARFAVRDTESDLL